MQGIRFSAMALPLGQKHDHRPVSAKDNVTGKTVTFDDWELRLQGAGNNGVKKGLPFEDPPYTLVADLKLNGKKVAQYPVNDTPDLKNCKSYIIRQLDKVV